MADFNKAYDITMGHEGGYVNDPDDRGGETYKGVARKFHQNWKGWLVIDKYTTNGVPSNINTLLGKDTQLQVMIREFYKEKFWDVYKADDIDSQKIAYKLFDIGVNQGTGTAGKYFQHVLNLLNNAQRHYSNIVEDGKVGANTIKAYNAYMETAKRFNYRSRESNIDVLYKCLQGEQYKRYDWIGSRNETQEKYMYGWVKRI